VRRNRKVLVAVAAATLGVTLSVAAAIASPARRHIRVVVSDAVGTTSTTTSTAPETSTTTRTTVDVPAATETTSSTVDSTTTSTTDDPCAPPPGALDSPSDLVSTVTFDSPAVAAGDSVGFTQTITNPHDQPVAFVDPLGMLLFPYAGFDGDLVAPEYGDFMPCGTFVVFPPHWTGSASGTFDATGYDVGRLDVQLWVQDHMVPLAEVGGPGGHILITPATDTSTTSTNPPTTLAGS